ncbi:ImuA family protein [Mesorhizobium marinum]|uniref:ImuA family protein n=1 Tax=Mesorhizobium marinum TaxID=3228790 RepID=A0ABV3R074_9HYPH
MATSALARETISSLRHRIAKIEGRLAERLGQAGPEDVDLARRHGSIIPAGGLLPTGAARFDAALGGGVPATGLTEIHAPKTRDAGAAAGFALALLRLVLEARQAPLLWVGMAESFREAGFPYPPGLRFLYGVDASRLLVAQAEKLADALWIAEQAAALDGFSAVLLETRGASAHLDLTATRRLHRRARDAGHPLFLLRQTARPEPTAAPFRLIVKSAPASLRRILGKPLARSIGPPAFEVEISKNRTAPPALFTLEWNSHARALQERAAENPVPVVPASEHRAPAAAAAGTLLAFAPAPGPAAAGRQPPGKQHPAHRRAG